MQLHTEMVMDLIGWKVKKQKIADEIGVHLATVYRWESGDIRHTSYETVEKIKALHKREKRKAARRK